MKNSNPRKIAIITALTVVVAFTILYIIGGQLLSPGSFLLFLLTDIILFIFTYLLFKYVLEVFIYEKIKIIYKTIHQLKVPTKEKRERILTKRDPIEKAHQEVIAWGEESKKEIESLRKLATYRKEFIGNVYHELKTPIFNIQGYVLTLLDGGLDDPTINKEYLLRTEKSINRMIAIIEDLEIISMLESGDLKLELERFDILDLTREVVDMLDMKAKKRKNNITFAGNYDHPIYVFADREKIRQVLTNLIDNALKYGQKKNGTTKLSFFDMDENILIEVTDNGMGIVKEAIPRLFERFYRTGDGRAREQHGTGLGLSIVKHVIEAHDQTINVRSTLGVGSTFAFTLKKG